MMTPSVAALEQAFRKCSDCMLNADYVPLLKQLESCELTAEHIAYLQEKCLSKKHIWEIRFEHLRVLLLNPSVRNYDLKAFFLDRVKASRRLSMKLFYIRGYAMYATETELILVMEKFCSSLKKNHDYMDYNEILSEAGLPYLVKTYGYGCFANAYDTALEESLNVPCLLGCYTLNERMEMVNRMPAEEMQRQLKAYLEGK